MSPTENNPKNTITSKKDESKKPLEATKAPEITETEDEKVLRLKKAADKLLEEKKPKVKKVPTEKLDKETAKKIKNAIYSKACPPQHFHGNDVAFQLELATEAGRHMLVSKEWVVEALTDSKGNITHIILPTKK